MDFFKLSNGSVKGFDNPAEAPAGAVQITADEFAQISTAPSAAQVQQQFKASAIAQLDIVTGPSGQFMRAYVAGIASTDVRLAPWQTHVQALRAIANGADTTSTTLPTQPAYIEGT